MLISRSKKVQGRSRSVKENSRRSPTASASSNNGSNGHDSSEGEAVGNRKYVLKKYHSCEEASSTRPEVVTNGTCPEVNALNDNKENEIKSLVNSFFGNGIPMLFGKESTSNAPGGVGTSSVILLEANDQSNGGNGGQASDDGNHDNDVSSPEAPIQSFVTVVPTAVNTGQSLKHLSASAPVMQSNLRTMGSESELALAPSTSKSRQKKFHRHFKTVAPDEKVLDYYSCALVGDILLQGYLYITENNFAFYSNVFGYVTKLLIPVSSVVRITKERTAKIIPNAVGLCTRSEKHVFASLLSRDTTYKLMCKVWNYSIDQEAKEVLKITTKLKEEDKCSGDLSVPDESSAESGSGNDSAIERLSPSTVGKLSAPKVVLASLPGSPSGRGGSAGSISIHPTSSASIVGTSNTTTVSTSAAYTRLPHRTSIVQATHPLTNVALNKKSTDASSKARRPSLFLLATALLVILFLSAALLLNRISNLQEKLSSAPTFRDSDQFYQELLSWQNKLHSSSAEEIHQYINLNLQQIVRVRQSLEALSLLFMSSQAENAKVSESTYQSPKE